MAGIEDFLAGTVSASPAARLAIIASDPADTTEEVYVTMPHFDGTTDHPNGVHLHGPCPWTPRVVDSGHYGIPSRGDRALVAFNEEDEPVIVTWWPDA